MRPRWPRQGARSGRALTPERRARAMPEPLCTAQGPLWSHGERDLGSLGAGTGTGRLLGCGWSGKSSPTRGGVQ